MTKDEKIRKSLFGCATRSVAEIEKITERLRKAGDKVSFESPEHHIISLAMTSLLDAESHLRILANRNTI